MTANRSSRRDIKLAIPLFFALLTGLFLIVSNQANGRNKSEKSFEATVQRVLDGDTIIVQQNTRAERITIRLADIDCPEKDQPFGAEATAFTKSFTMNRTVTIRVRATDRYHRTVADVLLQDGTSVNGALLAAGLAWWYRDYSTDKTLESLEQDAREKKRGLWSIEDPIPPWVHRRNKRKNL
ncbi:MAG: thermonuclease family protein [Deltaproteobacteria bacterium]|nr:thermonuclease family protein [Deltaproteobacteria bacterium]MBN2670820.1 thermonuclease family protein [Deltaproteobacteria bacterium]